MTKHKKNTAGDDDDAFDIVVSTSDPLDLDSKKEEETEEKQLQKEAAQSKVSSSKKSDKTASSKKTTPVKKVDTPESSDEDTENEEIDDQENKEITNLDKSDPPTKTANIEVSDVAKRLMDYNFHSPTMSWPVPGTLMIEPTESEDMHELDRLCNALISIREEIRQIEDGVQPKEDNVLKNAPHVTTIMTASDWNKPYTRELAAYPLPYLREHKFWPSVPRVDNEFGDKHLICSCPPLDTYF